MTNTMNIPALRAFTVLAATGSFSLAAQQLHLTQPAISKRIAALEQELNVRLFDRFSRHVMLTEAGTILHLRAQNILKAIDDCHTEISNLSGNVSGRLSIATSHHIGLYHLPDNLRKFSNLYNDVEIDLHFMGSEQACQKVAMGQLPLGIVTLPGNPIEHLKIIPLWQDPLSIVFGQTHPLTGILATNTETSPMSNKRFLAALQQLPLILPGKGTYTRDLIQAWFESVDIIPTLGMSTNYLETIKMLVNVGLGWSILPNTMTSSELNAVAIPSSQLTRQLGIVQHRSRTLSNAAIALVDLLNGKDNL